MAFKSRDAALAAVHDSWARTKDRAARTLPARQAQQAQFERQVDPDGTMQPADRAKAAENARKAHMARMRAARKASR